METRRDWGNRGRVALLADFSSNYATCPLLDVSRVTRRNPRPPDTVPTSVNAAARLARLSLVLVLRHHVLRKGSLARRPRNPHPVLPDRLCVSGGTVRVAP